MGQAGVSEKISINTGSLKKKKRNYELVIHNDDTTPFPLVIATLVENLKFTEQESEAIADEVHRNGLKVIKVSSSFKELEELRNKAVHFVHEYGFTEFNMTVRTQKNE